ncbi:MAG: metal ABC transporter permease, partial [Candidatus Saliniplasma sp.]
MFDILQYTFMRNAIYAGILASLIFGIIGTLVVVKRIVFISGGIAHASFGGVGMAFYLGIDPLIGASLFTVVSALGVGILGERKIEREDTTIGVIWAVGMALGAFFYSITPGYLPSPASFL